jgi:hypothetical protein
MSQEESRGRAQAFYEGYAAGHPARAERCVDPQFEFVPNAVASLNWQRDLDPRDHRLRPVPILALERGGGAIRCDPGGGRSCLGPPPCASVAAEDRPRDDGRQDRCGRSGLSAERPGPGAWGAVGGELRGGRRRRRSCADHRPPGSDSRGRGGTTDQPWPGRLHHRGLKRRAKPLEAAGIGSSAHGSPSSSRRFGGVMGAV